MCYDVCLACYCSGITYIQLLVHRKITDSSFDGEDTSCGNLPLIFNSSLLNTNDSLMGILYGDSNFNGSVSKFSINFCKHFHKHESSNMAPPLVSHTIDHGKSVGIGHWIIHKYQDIG